MAIEHGSFLYGNPYGIPTDSMKDDDAVYKAYVNDAVKRPSLIPMGFSFQDSTGRPVYLPVPILNRIIAVEATPMVTWGPARSGGGKDQAAFRSKDIAGGKYDTYINRVADQIKTWGKPLYLRFAHEMNGNWYSWSDGVNGNATGDFIRMWRHVYGIVAPKCPTVQWVWCANKGSSVGNTFASVYPGSAYVDVLSVDGYNRATGKGWRTPEQVFDPAFAALAKLDSTLPFAISETGCNDDPAKPGLKAAWVKRLLEIAPTRWAGRVNQLLYWSQNQKGGYDTNALQTSTPAGSAMAAWRDGIAKAIYTAA